MKIVDSFKSTFITKGLLIVILLISAIASESQVYPLKLDLKTQKASYLEGERIAFVLTLTNRDSTRTIPVILPGKQTKGKKLLRLCWYAKINKANILLQEEKPDLEMLASDDGTPELVYLKPGQSVSTQLYLNDFADTTSYQTKNESHHSFGRPFFAGEYLFKLHYVPCKSSGVDTVFNYVDSYGFFNGDIGPVNYFMNGKLIMERYGLHSNFCLLTIEPNKNPGFSFENRPYHILSTAKYRHYYCQGQYFGFTTKAFKNKLEIIQQGSEKIYMLTSPGGFLKEYKRVKDPCQLMLEGFKYKNNDYPVYWCSTNEDGVSTRINYWPDGRMDYQYINWNNGMATIIKSIYGKDKRLITEKRFDFEACRESQN